MKKLFYKNKILLIFIFMVFFSQNINANNKTYTILKDTVCANYRGGEYLFPKNTIFFEFAGVSGLYSLNYERSIFTKSNNNLSLRANFSYILLPMDAFIINSLMANYNRFLFKNILINIGSGISNIHFFDSTNNIYYSSNIGLSYFFKTKLFIQICPYLLYNEKSTYFWFGASIGFKFGKR